jgi:hypothetical protein
VKRTARLAAGVLLLLAASLAAAPAARAAGPRLLLDRAELEPSWFGGLARLRLHVTAIQLEGSLIPVGGADPFVLAIAGGRRREPYLFGRYRASGGATAVVIVVHTGWEMREELDAFRDAIGHLVGGLPEDAQVAVMSYGESIEGGHRLTGTRAAAAGRVDRLEPDAAPADPQLLGAVERAVRTLARARAPAGPGVPLRRMVIVLSDGKDVDPEPARYRAIGGQAGRQEVRVHAIAYSPVDDRGPLLGLGELSKRSGGTFRWVRARAGFRSQIDTLVSEIRDQVVLTFFIPPEQVVGKRLAVRLRDLESNEVRLSKVECGGAACDADHFCVRHHCVARGDGGGGGVWRWLLWGAGGLVGLLLLAGAAGALAERARARAGAAPHPALPQPGLPGQGAGPAAMPSSASLFVAAGPFQGRRMPLRHGFLVGSARGCDFLIPGDPRVAPHHAIFVSDGAGGFAVIDRGSATGTFVNGVRITESRLKHGNLIRVAGCDLRYLIQ